MAGTIRVKPVEGRSLPLEDRPSRRINKEMNVPDRVYYRRAIARGDIALAEAPAELSEKVEG